MPPPFLKTKLYIPPLRSDLVPRPHLIKLLNEGSSSGGRLTLVSAPAGYGKTTLLSAWVTGCELPVAWLSLDPGDNDPARFLSYLISALQTVKEGVGQGVLSVLQSSQAPDMPELSVLLVNQIDSIPERLVLVIDDYHTITSQSVHSVLSFLLDHIPPRFHLIIATRADPPLPLSRLRGNGQLLELRQAELRFSLEEVKFFLDQGMGLTLSEKDLSLISSRTEGWIAALQMAAIPLRGHDDVTGFIRGFTGNDKYILDYLVEEVLQHQPEYIQKFLLRTSILDRFTGALCDAILNDKEHVNITNLLPCSPISLPSMTSSQAILAYLERNNIFIISLDNERHWYRYHHLFADLLRHRQERLQPDLIPTLHRRASAWFADHDLSTEAINHALVAKDLEWATYLIEQAAEKTALRSEFVILLQWMEALPEDHIQNRPRLCMYKALALVLGGHSLDLAQACVQNVVESDTDGAVAGEVMAFRALIAAYRGEREYSAELSQQALTLLPENNLFFRSLVAGFMGLASLYSGDIYPATRAFQEAVRVSQKTGNLTVSVLARCHLAELSMLRGQLEDSKMLYEQALELAISDQELWHPIAGVALIGLGRVALERYELEKATRLLTEGIELTLKWGEASTSIGYVGLARLRQTQGDILGAWEAIQKAQQLAVKFDAMEIDNIHASIYQTGLWIAEGNFDAAECWIERRRLVDDLSPSFLTDEIRHSPAKVFRFLEYSMLAQVRLAQERLDDALNLLGPLLQVAESAGWQVYSILVLTLQSLTFYAHRDVDKALSALEKALSLAEPGGVMHVFIAKGPAMARLLHQAVRRGISSEFAGRLLAAFPVPERLTQLQNTSGEYSAIVEPLSERELEVLHQLATHLSSTEIAQQLFISVNTVRFHIKNIYSKLGVHNRVNAVLRGKELKLL